MGEPAQPTYKRHYEFRRWPVSSASELANYTEWLIDLVRQSGEAEPQVRLKINVLGRASEANIPLQEFRERFDEFPFDKIYEASLDVWDGDGFILTFKLNASIFGDADSSVTVTGTDRERVQRVKTKVRDEGDARVEAARRVKAEAEAKAKADADFKRQKAAVGIGDTATAIFEAEAQREQERRQRPPRHPENPPIRKEPVQAKPAKSESRVRRFFYNPWTITIGGGLVVGLVLLLTQG